MIRCAIVALVVLGASLTAQGTPRKGPAIDPVAMGIVERADALIRSAPRVSFRARVTYDQVLSNGQKLQFSGDLELALKRPGKLAATYRGDLDVKKAFCDGSQVVLYDQRANVYGVVPVAGMLHDALRETVREAGFSIPLVDLVVARPGRERFEGVVTGTYVGLHRVRGVACHHLAFTGADVDWQLWIEDGVESVPRKVVITHKKRPGSPQYIAWIRDWNFAPHLPDRLFAFVPPRGVERIEFLKPEAVK